MKKMPKKILEVIFTAPAPAEAASFRASVTTDNIYRERILAQLVLVASLLLMIVDYSVSNFHAESHRSLSFMAILFRASFCVFLVIFLIATRKKPAGVSSRLYFWDTAMVGGSLAWLGSFSGALLAVRPGTEPYLMGVLITGCFLFQAARRTMLLFSLGFLSFAITAFCFRPEFPLLLSSLINVTLATFLAFVISRIVFRMRLESFRNARDIAGQRRLMQESVEHLQKLSYLDPLTGIANRRFLEMSLSREWKLESRSRQLLSIIMIDIDWFKLFNDTYGHIPGDDCLRKVAAALEASVLRPGDLVSRYGGEEFCVLLPMTNREGAIFTAKRMMKAIHDLRILHRCSDFGQVTVSMGIATRQPQHTEFFESLIHAADSALYHAKVSGKNRIAWCCPVAMDEFPHREVSAPTLHKSIALECSADFDLRNLVEVG
ncbi:MAG: GGDEF domain-containing protein [Deltaproteobacteria bacterium]|nr:GGDEF domain-containing protein [Deltaproteobacteria bacterium]TLN04648.1 MAG: GGDEF domain-containing protein [bacterium]